MLKVKVSLEANNR